MSAGLLGSPLATNLRGTNCIIEVKGDFGNQKSRFFLFTGVTWAFPAGMDATVMDTVIIVPARLQSVRFPRKLLHEIHGKPLILWTAQRLAEASLGLPFYFAVEDQELEMVLEEAGFEVFRTSEDHRSGTDRIAEVNQHLRAEHVLNVQADEPLVTAEQLRALNSLIHGDVDMATLAFPFSNEVDFYDPNCVKTVLDHQGRALYFSRAPIPFPRDVGFPMPEGWLNKNSCYHHIGVYAYKRQFLAEFSQMPQGRLERVERLEQLRALENGYRIAVGVSSQPTVGLDTPEDAARLEGLLGPG